MSTVTRRTAIPILVAALLASLVRSTPAVADRDDDGGTGSPALANSLPSNKTCKRAPFTLRLRGSEADPLTSASVYVNGRRVAKPGRRQLRHRFTVPGLPRAGRFQLRVVASTDSGRRLSAQRTYRVCPPPLPVRMPGCADTHASAARGDWTTYGQDLSGHRFQSAEHALTPAVVPALTPAFVFRVAAQGMDGSFQATPIESNGCVYMGTSTGWAFAINADSGKLVWKRKLPVGAPGLLGTGIVGSPAVDHGRVFVAVSQSDTPYGAALDQRTGKLLWKTTLVKQTGAYNDASPVVARGMVFVGFNGDEEKPTARGGFTVLDARTGGLLVRTYTVPDDAFKNGYNGGSIWATAAIDTRGRYAYVGTGNPQGPSQYKYTNAILKIDLDRSRHTFGRIVDYYAGTPDAAFPIEHLPTCQASRGQIIYVVSVACTHEDVDFGASPQLFRDASGRQIVGELQKSGIYHAAYTSTMKRAWTTKVGDPAVITNGGTGASDGKRVYAEGTPVGTMFALDRSTGGAMWQAPVGDPIHFQATTAAAGVVYTVDGFGNLRAWDAATGASLLTRSMVADTGDTGGGGNNGGAGSDTSASVSVARGRVFAATGGDIIAYRAP